MPRRLRARTVIRPVRALLALVAIALVVGVNLVFGAMTMSTPRESGVVRSDGVGDRVTIGRDALGRPRIDAASLDDATFALGFLHGQDRFFQMDAARRYAAGSLAELIGPPGIGSDVEARQYDAERTAEAALSRLPPRHRRMLEDYAAGVNAGLADLGAWPPEYVLLGCAPIAWTPKDSMLVVLGMFRGLALVGDFEFDREAMDRSLPPEVVRFLLPETTRFDATVTPDGEPARAPIPPAEVFDVRALTAAHRADSADAHQTVRGSNGWAVGGTKTIDGRAILVSDMHLGLMVPTQWYWAESHWKKDGAPREAIGLTLPGMPGLVVGSNGRVAWGFTNVTGDVADWVVVEPDAADPDRYKTPEGTEPFETECETIRVRFGPDHTSTVRRTRWGRVIPGGKGTPDRVMRWTGSDPESIDLGLLDMLDASTVEEALTIAAAWKGPPQNTMVAGADGRIGWTISGAIPIRSGIDGRTPASWAVPGVGWIGFMPPESKPRVISPPEGYIATANARTVAPDAAPVFGTNFALGVRQARIASMLEASTDPIDERAMERLQNDTTLDVYEYWRDVLIRAAGDDPDLADAASAARAWDGRADGASPGLPLIQGFRWRVRDRIYGPIEALIKQKTGMTVYPRGWLNSEETTRRVLEDRPDHWLDAKYATWDELERDALRDQVERMDDVRAPDRIVSAIRHPLSWAAGSVIRRFDMPLEVVKGDPWAIRVMAPTFGASERMSISPGREGDGRIELPCGPSGHPMSRWYRSMHRGWIEGEGVGAAVHPVGSGFIIDPPPIPTG